MNKIGKIKKIACPKCKKLMYLEEENCQGIGTKQNRDKTYHWTCGKCVEVYPQEWFDVFFPYENHVFRSGENRDKWNRNLLNLKDIVKVKGGIDQ